MKRENDMKIRTGGRSKTGCPTFVRFFYFLDLNSLNDECISKTVYPVSFISQYMINNKNDDKQWILIKGQNIRQLGRYAGHLLSNTDTESDRSKSFLLIANSVLLTYCFM